MAFESLTERFSKILKKVRGQARLTEKNMDEMLQEVRIALFEADVNFKVVKEFVENIKKQAIGTKVYDTLNPGQMVVKIVNDELVKLLGSADSELIFEKNKPTIIMLVGLQGTGKTTTAGKLALLFKKKMNKRVLLAAADVYRPAAIDQLDTLARQVGVDIVNLGDKVTPVEIAKAARKKAYDDRYDVLIIDTAGRLTIDDTLMTELKDMKEAVNPTEILLLVDAMSGQDAVNTALSFNQKLGLTGAIMSKLDSDARGGAALSIKHLTGVSIKFAGVGETLEDLDIFYPDRMADRILGMGDVLTLVEKAQEQLDEKAVKKTTRKMLEGEFDLNDMLSQMKQVQKLGKLGGILKLIPGMPKITPEQQELAEREMKLFEVIINSMTPEERNNPAILKNSRKVRIAKGSGTSNQEINKVLKKYEQMKQVMKQMKGYKKGGPMPPGFPGMM
ncbi:MAG: Signal recognition particle protein [Tenericutes bacterium ADurb.Bin239]|jgi:signal recognition particle subunit SRP54|nr:MAG: Signal recognition particle protein [Tenericutes bacterium ADurb.Bin239]